MSSSLANVLKWGGPVEASCAVVLIQGLGGRIHAPIQPDTQGAFVIEKLLADFPEYPVYGLSYPSHLGDFKTDDSLNSHQIIQALAYQIQQVLFTRHQYLLCIGYCLGGYYLSRALSFLVPTIRNKVGLPGQMSDRMCLLFIDAPYTLTPEGLTPWFKGILDILKITPEELLANAAYWQSLRGCRLWEKTSALVSDKASWVTSLVPDMELPNPRLSRVDTDHNDLLLSPQKGEGEVYNVIKEFVENSIRTKE
ncbi:MAG: hypothetical protein AAFQ98_00195 [Bacteroidota bacterium]